MHDAGSPLGARSVGVVRPLWRSAVQSPSRTAHQAHQAGTGSAAAVPKFNLDERGVGKVYLTEYVGQGLGFDIDMRLMIGVGEKFPDPIVGWAIRTVSNGANFAPPAAVA